MSCHKAVPFEEFLETDDKLTLLKKVAEIQGPLDVDYRCIDCRDCKKCKDSGKIERISLREELEMEEIRKSVRLNYEEKRIDCSLPLRGPERDFLSSNKKQAVAILNQQCQKYFGDPQVLEGINKAFKKLMDKGFIRMVSDLSEEERNKFENKEVQYYIPWRCVWKDSMTTPVRPVLDASTNSPKRKDASGGSNLNNAVCHGKIDSLDLLGVLLRFVLLDHAVAADITKMYNMFNLDPEYWNLQRVVFKDDLNPNNEVLDAVITTLIYGVSSVSGQTEEGCKQIAVNGQERKPEASETIRKSRYVDNLLNSFRNNLIASGVTKDVDDLFAEVGLFTRGWTHTGQEPNQEESADGVSLELMGVRWFSQFDTLQIKIPRLHFGKRVRGRLDPNTVLFEGDFSEMSKFVPDPLTRRQVVSKRAGIYDVFGKITPIIAKLKVFERSVFNSTSSWDDGMPSYLRNEAVQNFIMIEKLRGIHYQRAKIPTDAVSDIARLILTVDAATEVINITIYIGFKRVDGSWSCDHLLGRCALSDHTLARNEMQSMTAGSNLVWVVMSALSGNVGEQITCGDSEIVLHWILSDHRKLETWLRNRVVQIRRLIDLDNLYHVSSKNNPSDIGTRTVSITEADVLPGGRYLSGDYWMTLDTKDAIEQKYLTPAADLRLKPSDSGDYSKGMDFDPENPEVIVKGHNVDDQSVENFKPSRKELILSRAEVSQMDPDLMPTKRAFPKQLRVTTFVITFVGKLLNRIGKKFRGPFLSECKVKLYIAFDNTKPSSLAVMVAEESVGGSAIALSQVMVTDWNVMYTVQKSVGKVFVDHSSDFYTELALQFYFKEATIEVKHFNSKSFLDKIAVDVDGILLSKSRVHDVLNFIETGDLQVKDLGALNIKSKVPVTDRFSPLSYSIASYVHGIEHRGVESTFRIVQEQVHIIRGFGLLKEIDSDCIKCKKKRGKFCEVLMGPIDDNQVTVTPAFYCCQIDLMGPVKVFCPGFERDTRNSKAKETKNWILVAACTTTKALNIQVVDKSDTRGILEALSRLGCEATWPKFFYCDADSAILKIMKDMNVELRNFQYQLYSEHGAIFEVCPVGGHERQGLVERRISTVQSSLKELGLATMRIHSMGLQTMCKMVENTLNNLPYGFTQARSDTNQSLYKLISPNLLRHGRNNNRSLSGPVKLSSDNNKMLQEVEKRNDAWFKIFKDSCIPNLVMQQKWFKNETDLAVGDLVYFRKTDSELGEGDWCVGLIDQVIPSKDMKIRKVIVKYRNTNEDFDRFSKRNSRKIVKLWNVEDESVWDDLSWVQQKIVEFQKVPGSNVHASPVIIESKFENCISCCCRIHCNVTFHGKQKQKQPFYSDLETGYGILNAQLNFVSDIYPDFDATVANLNVEDWKAINKQLCDQEYI